MTIRTHLYLAITHALLVSFSINAFAVCEGEQKEYLDWVNKCDTLSAASVASGTAGGIFAIVTLGASMIPCAAAIAAANNACRIRDEKKQSLERCVRHQASLAAKAKADAEKALAKQKKKAKINKKFDEKRSQKIATAEQTIASFVDTLESEGYDLQNLDTQELIRTTRSAADVQLDQELKQVEKDRKRALKDV